MTDGKGNQNLFMLLVGLILKWRSLMDCLVWTVFICFYEVHVKYIWISMLTKCNLKEGNLCFTLKGLYNSKKSVRILRGAQEIKKTRLTETRIWFVFLLLAIFLSRLCFDMFDVGSHLREFDRGKHL